MIRRRFCHSAWLRAQVIVNGGKRRCVGVNLNQREMFSARLTLQDMPHVRADDEAAETSVGMLQLAWRDHRRL